MLAVDEPQTSCREDAFLLERFDNGSAWKLTVASVIPPENLCIDYESFLANIFSQRGEPPEYFLKQRDYFKCGLKTHEPRHVLMAIFEFDKCNNFTIKVATGYAVIEAMTYHAFSSLPDFNDIKSGIEEFIFQYYHIDWKYTSRQGEEYWETEATPARRLISAVLDMFSSAVSKYAHSQRLKTLKIIQGTTLQLRLHDQAKFRGPLRRAVSFVNILNVTASIEGGATPFSHERLQYIAGDTCQIKP